MKSLKRNLRGRVDKLRKDLEEDLKKLDELNEELKKIENETKNNQVAS